MVTHTARAALGWARSARPDRVQPLAAHKRRRVKVHALRRAGVVAVALLALSGVLVGAGADGGGDSAPLIPERSRAYSRVDAHAGCGTPIGTRTADASPADWPGVAGGVNGTGYYAGGEYIWTDYTNDDAGTGGVVYPGEGDYLLPGPEGSVGRTTPVLDKYGASSADIVELRLAADDEAVHALAVVNFLNAIDTTMVTIGFDLDGDPATGIGSGTGRWPLNAGLRTPGADLFVTAHPTGADGYCATVTTDGGDVSLAEAGGTAAVDTTTNTVEVSMPRSFFGRATTPRVVVGSGLWEPTTGGFKRPIRGSSNPGVPEEARTGEATDLRGGATAADTGILNLLFRGDEPMIDNGNAAAAANNGHKRAFEYLNQAAVLQGGTSGPYALDLDLARVLPGAPAEPIPLQRGSSRTFTRQYISRIDLEGILWFENDASRDAIYLGRRQSYAVHLPPCVVGEGTCPAEGVPLAVSFHGGSGSHVNEMESFVVKVAEPMARRASVLTIAPFGRGRRAPWWRGLAEVDVFEAMADAEATYGVDPDRRLAYGGSLGGYGTLRFTTLYPDVWAGAAAYCPATYENSTSTREPGNEVHETQQFTVMPWLGSLINTPVVQVSGTIDPLVRIDNGRALRDRLLAEGVDLRYTEWVNGQHCTWVPETSQRYPDWHINEMLSMLERGRTSRPAVVSYTVDPRQLVPGSEYLGIAHLEDVGVRHDRAWWVSDIRMRSDAIAAGLPSGTDIGGNTVGGPGDDVVGRVRAVSHMLDGWQRSVESCGDTVGIAGVSGNTEVRQTPGGATGITYPDPHFFRCQRQLRSTPAIDPVVDLTVDKIGSLAIDVADAGVAGPFTVVARGDGVTTLRLRGPVPGSPAWKAPGSHAWPAVRASGLCVRSQRKLGHDLIVDLQLGAVPCQVSVS